MKLITFLSPKKILAASGALAQVGAVAAPMGRKALVVTGGSSFKKSGALNRLVASLEAAGVAYALYEGVPSDPDVETVEAGCAVARAEACDMVIAAGGGSVLDAAKGMGVLAANGGSILDYEFKAPAKPMLPMIAIPTTAGTASEVTKYAVITDNVRKKKMLIAYEGAVPDVALLDPALTFSMPPAITAATGMDALTHAVEGYISDRKNPIGDLYGLEAVRLIAKHLPAAVFNPVDAEAREGMLLGQMYAGLCFSNATTCLVHSMSRPLGVLFGAPHGEANALLLPAVLEYNLPACIARYAALAGACGIVTEGRSELALAKEFVAWIAEFQSRMPLKTKLAQFGVSEKDVPVLAGYAVEPVSTKCNPRKPTLAEIEALYTKLL